MSPIKTSEQVRKDFLDFFKEKQHEIVESDSIVPHNDPTLLFTNAGMNQFKDVFLGSGTRPYKRAADTQKCLRVSGKHNDLEEVGYDTYHHTFFEMLGNWSFGDYFKQEAIRWAWELLVGRWGLDPQRLYATVHEGDDGLGLSADTEAADYWKRETGINPDHVLFFGSKDNFWMMGDTGPCGPCSEVHVDLRSDEERALIPGKDLVNADHPMVMEIWNLVFIQYNALTDGSLDPLSAKHVDTGMGFERMVAVLQGHSSTYDTDLFAPMLQRIADLSPIAEIVGYDDIQSESEADTERYRIAMRVVADHIRTIAIAIADGVMPGNVGRGYVIRRILRRAVRYGYQSLLLKEPFLYKLLDALIDKMGASFPELIRNRPYMERVIRAEEESFLETLGNGLVFFDRITPFLNQLAETGESVTDEVKQLLLNDRQTLDILAKAYVGEQDRSAMIARFIATGLLKQMPGEIAFLLHDTFGFPVDLTQLMARELNLDVEMSGYNALMKAQKDRARAAATFTVDQSSSEAWQQISSGEDSVFLGYEQSEVAGASIRAIRAVPGKEGEEIYQLVLDQTPFYAESGGQVGDTGTLVVGDEVLQVLDTQKTQTHIIHTVDHLPVALDAEVLARVDIARLARIKKHHTVTHLMHAALREILGEHVTQKGSLVAPDHLRFDFSHFERVSAPQIREIELRVNEVIQRNISLQEDRAVPIDEALARGAMALFGEKYGDTVRVITFDPEYSVELCGGIHVDASGEIGVFRFVSEGSVAAGIRRVVAVAGEDALHHLNQSIDELERVRRQFKSLQRPVDEEIADLLDQQKRLEKVVETLRQQQLAAHLDRFIGAAVDIDSTRLITGRVDGVDMPALRTLGETLRDRMGAGSIGVLGGVDPEGEKVYLVAAVSDDVIKTQHLQAGKLVGTLAKLVGGGGGGRPNLATAGGKQPENLDEALQAAEHVVRELMS